MTVRPGEFSEQFSRIQWRFQDAELRPLGKCLGNAALPAAHPKSSSYIFLKELAGPFSSSSLSPPNHCREREDRCLRNAECSSFPPKKLLVRGDSILQTVHGKHFEQLRKFQELPPLPRPPGIHRLGMSYWSSVRVSRTSSRIRMSLSTQTSSPVRVVILRKLPVENSFTVRRRES